MSSSKIGSVRMSPSCENFIGAVLRQNWLDAFSNLNRLNMYEMLRGLAALDRLDLNDLMAHRVHFTNLVNMPRIEYAVEVVTKTLNKPTSQNLPTAPGDLQATGQVAEAISFNSNPTPLIFTRDLTGQIGTTGEGAPPLTDKDFETVAKDIGVEVAAIMAVGQVESGSGGFATDGRPIVRYELHVFEALTDKVYTDTHPHLSQPYKESAGDKDKDRLYHNGSQSNEWSMIYGASILRGHTAIKAIKAQKATKNHPAIKSISGRPAAVGGFEGAWKATSWGRFQVLGINHNMYGFKSVTELVYSMYKSELNQLEACKNHLINGGGLPYLKKLDWWNVTAHYNGTVKNKTTGQREVRDNYDKKLETAYNRISADRKARKLTP